MVATARPIGAPVNPLLAAVGVIVVMALAVLATMAVENWRQLVRPIPFRSAGRDAEELDDRAPGLPTWDPVAGPELVPEVEIVALEGALADEEPDGAVPAGTDDQAHTDDQARTVGQARTDDPAGTEDPAGAEDAEPAAHVFGPGVPDGALSVSGRTVELRDEATVDVLAALLFAGLASTRRSGADRAAAWVTAAATPPSADPDRFPAGVRLRGRTAKVAELLAHHDGGAVWVGMQPGVDIARGLARTPVTQPTLAGLVAWWRSTRDLPTVVEPSVAAEIAASIESVTPQLDLTPWSEVVGRLHDALAAAAEDGEPLLVALADAGDVGDGDRTGRDERSATAEPVSDGPTPAVPTS